jgi:predicted membrane protein
MTKLCWHHKPLARSISLLLASGLSVLILVYPQPLISNGQTNHSLLMLLLLSCSLGFIHGVGFKLVNSIWRELTGPILSWPVMIYGLILMLE